MYIFKRIDYRYFGTDLNFEELYYHCSKLARTNESCPMIFIGQLMVIIIWETLKIILKSRRDQRGSDY